MRNPPSFAGISRELGWNESCWRVNRLGNVPHYASSNLLIAQETDDGIAGLGTAPQPILDAFGVELDLRRILEWVVGPHDFDKATVAGAPLVDHHYAITRHLLLANPSQTNRQHATIPPLSFYLGTANSPTAHDAGQFGVAEAVHRMVIDHAGGLHEGVADGGADKAEAALLEGA